MRHRRSNCHYLSGKGDWTGTKIWKALRRTEGASDGNDLQQGISQVLINRGVMICRASVFCFI